MTYLGPNTSYPASERCPELRQAETKPSMVAQEPSMPTFILRPEGFTDKEWHDYHCAELARLRRERNSRGETVPLNRGRVEVERVRVVRG